MTLSCGLDFSGLVGEELQMTADPALKTIMLSQV
jgi:hypothetical protein